ncbi:unnamed protein product, partial [Polarella glacialis]
MAAVVAADRSWAVAACRAAVSLLSCCPPQASTVEELRAILQTLWEAVSLHQPPGGAESVHSKVLDVATATGDYFGIYSMDLASLKQGTYAYTGSEVGFVATAICSGACGDKAWRVFRLADGRVESEVIYSWEDQ